MAYLPNTIYHIYNQGNNQQTIFIQEQNYLYFLHKLRNELAPYLSILAYCLMPNRFHLLVYTNAQVCQIATSNTTGKPMEGRQVLTKKMGKLLSSYTRAINKQEERTGSLFRRHTKFKECFTEGFLPVDHLPLDYATNCFHYIHQNPVKAGLVTNEVDWIYSSAQDYAGLRAGTLPDKTLAKELGLI